MEKLIYSIGLMVFAHILHWFQMQTQFMEAYKTHWFWTNPYWMSIFGLPIGYLFFEATRLSYEHFGFTWNIRMIGFGLGTIIFGTMSYLLLREIPTLKTIICILLALSIILIQITNVTGE